MLIAATVPTSFAKCCIAAANKIDLSSPLLLEEIEDLIRGIDFHSLTPNDFYRFFPEDHVLAALLVGMWGYDLLADPKFVDNHLIGYNSIPLSDSEKNLATKGLIEVLKRCRVEDESSENAVDYHYHTCGNLYQLEGENAERLLVDELTRSICPNISIRLIEALGVLVGFQRLLQESTVKMLLEIARSDSKPELRRYAQKTLIDDVLRVNNESNFLKDPSEIAALIEKA